MSAQCSFSQVIINLSYVGVPYHVAPWIRWSTVSCNNYKLKTALTSHKWRLINNEISAQRRRKQCELAVVKREPKISPRRRPNSRSNRPTNTQTHKHTDRGYYNTLRRSLARSVTTMYTLAAVMINNTLLHIYSHKCRALKSIKYKKEQETIISMMKCRRIADAKLCILTDDLT